jgi:hypothetical protein
MPFSIHLDIFYGRIARDFARNQTEQCGLITSKYYMTLMPEYLHVRSWKYTCMHSLQKKINRMLQNVQARQVRKIQSPYLNHLRSPGIDFQPGGPVRQPYLTYRFARLHRLAESIPWNWFLGSLKVYKFRLRYLPSSSSSVKSTPRWDITIYHKSS